MREFVAFVKENVAGQGIIQEVTPPKIATTKQISGNLDDPDWFPPPPPELLVNLKIRNYYTSLEKKLLNDFWIKDIF